MAPYDAAIGFAEDGMKVQCRTVIANRYIAEKRRELDLLIDGNLVVLLCFPLEISQRCSLERANGRNRGGLHLLLPHELAQRVHYLISRIEHDRVGDGGIDIGAVVGPSSKWAGRRSSPPGPQDVET
jgi:hypothetical protein